MKKFYKVNTAMDGSRGFFHMMNRLGGTVAQIDTYPNPEIIVVEVDFKSETDEDIFNASCFTTQYSDLEIR